MIDAAFKSHCPIAVRKQLPASNLSILIHDSPERLMVRDRFQILNCIGDMIMPTQTYTDIVDKGSKVQLYKNSNPVLPPQNWSSLTPDDSTTVDLNTGGGVLSDNRKALWFLGGSSGQTIIGKNQSIDRRRKLANVINGAGGNDTITGADGNDWLYGDVGNDVLSSGNGNDRLSGGDGNDTILGGSGNDFIYGDLGNDRLTGDAGDDTLSGELGNDTISGGDNNDVIFGGVGNDSIYGDDGNDVLYGDGGNVAVTKAVIRDGEVISGVLSVGDGKTTVNGMLVVDGNDKIFGGTGNDTLIGGAGADTLEGGSGRDAFVFFRSDNPGTSATISTDTITDFNRNEDKIWVDWIDYTTSVSSNKPLAVSITQTRNDAELTFNFDAKTTGIDYRIILQNFQVSALGTGSTFQSNLTNMFTVFDSLKVKYPVPTS